MNAQPQSDQLNIPLHQLALSPRNARKTGGHDIDGLAASIVAHGLLQNLTVTRSEPHVPGTEATFEVVAGGRRLAALQQLASTGAIDTDFEVPCRVINDDDVALEASTAENTLREAMHPADQFIAFKGMVDNGKAIADIAAHFGVADAVVKQRLKLANVDPQLVQIYREGGMQLDQLQALALTDDHEDQRRAWFGPKHDYERDAWQLRAAITKADVRASNGVARFVGLEAYEAAGGAVRRDMFSSSDEVWLCDRDLLGKLAIDKLEEQRQKELAAGWSWAEVHMSLDYSQVAAYTPLYPIAETWLPPEKQARLDEVEARIAEIEVIDADSVTEEQDRVLADELNLLEIERDEIQDASEERWPADAMAKSGVLIYIQNGDVNIDRGRLQPGQKLDMKSGAVTGTAKPGQSAKDKPKKPTLSQDMQQRLDLHRAAVLRQAIATHERPGLAVEMLATHLLTNLIGNTHAGLFDLRANNVDARTASGVAQSKQWNDVIKSSARQLLAASIANIKRDMPKKASDVFAWVQKLDPVNLDKVLATCTALMLENISGKQAEGLAKLLKIDMTQWWQPDAHHYLAVVPKTLVLEAVTEARGKEVAAKLSGLKKERLIAEAGRQLAGTGWLPKPLRGPGYALKKSTVAKPGAGKQKRPGGNRKQPAKKDAAKSAAKKSPA